MNTPLKAKELGLKPVKGGGGNGTIYPRPKGSPAPAGVGKPKGSKNKRTLLNELFTYLADPRNKKNLAELGFGNASDFVSFAKGAGLDPLMAKQIQLAFGNKRELDPNGEPVVVDINPDVQRKTLVDIFDRLEGKPIAKTLTADVSADEILDDIIDSLSDDLTKV